MSDDSTSRSLDRGQFLKRAGAAGVALATMPLASTDAWAGIAKKTAMKPLKIGNLLTLSGPNAAPAIDVRRGFVAYVYSHGHRIGGRKIQFFDADDANNPATAIQQVQKLVQEDQVDVIEGIFYSSVLLAVRDTIDQLQVPTVIANAAANALSRDRLSAYIYRTSYSNYQLGVPLGPWAATTFGKGGVVAAITANYAAGQESAAAFKSAYEGAGGSLLGTIFTPFPTTPDYQPYFQQAADLGAKAVWAFTAGGGEAIKFVTTWRQFGFDKRFQLFGSNNMTDPQSVLDAEGDAALGIARGELGARAEERGEPALPQAVRSPRPRPPLGVRGARLHRGSVPRSCPAQDPRRHEQQAALPQRDGERRHLAVTGREADDGPEDAQRHRAGLPLDRREARLELHPAAGLDDRHLQGAGLLRRPACQPMGDATLTRIAGGVVPGQDRDPARVRAAPRGDRDRTAPAERAPCRG